MARPAKSQLTIGIGTRNYNYQRMVYGLPVGNARFAKRIYLPWKFLGADPRLHNTYAFVPCLRCDLYHLWNGILLNHRPFVTSFELNLPRVFNGYRGAYYQMALRRLRSPDCRRLLAMSEFAKRFFGWQHRGELDQRLTDKLEVFYGGVAVPENVLERRFDALARERDQVFRCCFVGHEFFRKGGYPVVQAFVRLAKRYPEVRLVVVSRVSANDYASHESEQRADEVRSLLQTAPWAEWHEALPHEDVMRLLTTCRVGLLPTLDDTFGWSSVEAMSHGLPIISTNVCAIPEVVTDGQNGYLIPLDRDEMGMWSGMSLPANSAEFKAAREAAYQRVEDGVVEAVTRLIEWPDIAAQMSTNAVSHVQKLHDPARQGQRLMEIYRDAVAG